MKATLREKLSFGDLRRTLECSICQRITAKKEICGNRRWCEPANRKPIMIELSMRICSECEEAVAEASGEKLQPSAAIHL
jgi:hypothetical protein